MDIKKNGMKYNIIVCILIFTAWLSERRESITGGADVTCGCDLRMWPEVCGVLKGIWPAALWWLCINTPYTRKEVYMSRPSFSSDFFPSIHRCFTFATDHVKYSPLPSAINSSNNFHQFPADGPMTEGLRSLPPVPGSTIGFDNQRSGNFFNYLDFFTCRVLKKTNNKIRSDKRSTSSLAVVPASFHFCLIWLFFISLFFIFHFFFLRWW